MSIDKRFGDSVIRHPQLLPVEDQPEQIRVEKWPVLQEEAKFGWAWKLAEAGSKDSEADPVAILYTALTAAGAAFGAKAFFQVGETPHPPRLFTAVIGASAKARKGTSLGPVKTVLKACGELLAVENVLSLKTSPGPLSTGEGIIWAVRDASEEVDEDGNPKHDGIADKRLLVTDSELASLLTASARAGNTVSTMMRTLWDDGDCEPLTKTSKTKCTAAHVCIVGHITSDEFKQKLTTVDAKNGFINRFLFVAAKRPKKVALAEPMPIGTVQTLARELAEAIKASQRIQGRVAFTDSAKELWIAAYDRLTTDRPGALGDATARAEAQVIRLALTYALLDKKSEIDSVHLEAALAAWQFCEDSAALVLGRGSDELRAKILDALKAGPQRTDDLRKLCGAKAADMQNALEGLQSASQVQIQVEDSTGGRGRRPQIVSLAA